MVTMNMESGFAEETARIAKEVVDAANAGDDPRAYQLAQEALATGARHPVLFNVRATWFFRQGLYQEALGDLESARAFSPGNPVILDAIGNCLMRLGHWELALQALEAATAAAPKAEQIQYRRGLASQMCGKRPAAKAAHLRATELKPDYADPFGSLALISIGEDNPANAALHAERALAIDPRQPTAHIALAMAELRQGDANAAKIRIQEILRQQEFGRDPKANEVLHVIANAFDRLDDVSFAFAIFTALNAKRREIHARRFASNRACEQAARLAAYFESAPQWNSSRKPVHQSHHPAGHVFVLGFARSGTSLLETILASNAHVAALDERDCFPVEAAALLDSTAGMDRLLAADEHDLEAWRKAYWETVRQAGLTVSGKVFVDKWPFNSRRLPLIAALFPQAKVIFTLRDPRDVVFSCFRHSFALNDDTFEFLTLDGCARYYCDVMNAAMSSRRKLPVDVLEHRYEDMIADFDTSIRAVCAFIGIPWKEDMRDFASATGTTLRTNSQSRAQVGRGLYTGGAGQWERYREQLAPVLPVLRPWVERFGYPADE